MNGQTHGKLRSDFFWSAMELAMRYGVQLVTILVLARLIAPREFGLMAIAMIVIAVGNVISDSGMTVALTRLADAKPAHFATALRFGELAGVACIALCVTLAWPLSRLFDAPDTAGLLIVASLSLPVVGAAAPPDAYLIRARRFADRARVQAIASVLASGMAILVAALHGGAWALVAQLLTASIARTVLLLRLAPVRGKPEWASLTDLLPLSGYLVASSLLDAIATRVQAAVLGRLFGAQELGFYAQAQNIQQVPTTAFSAIVNKVALGPFADADRNGTLPSVARNFLRATYLVFCPLMVLSALLALPLLPVVLGARWAPAAPILAILCAAAALWPVHLINLLVCTARGNGRTFLFLEVAKKLVLIAAVAVIGWRGPRDMALAVFIASVIGAGINASYSARAIGYGPLNQMRDLLPATLATLAAAGVAWWSTDRLSLQGLPAAATMAAIFAITYALPGAALSGRAIADWKGIVSK